MRKTIAIILAAGRGTRMKSDKPKVMHEILGRAMISYVVDSVKAVNAAEIIAVTGYGSDKVEEFLKSTNIKTALQKKLLGSADAVLAATKKIKNKSGNILIVYGDTPLIRKETIRRLIDRHNQTDASLTLMAAVLRNPTGYGRIIRNTAGKILKISEETEIKASGKEIREVNVGTCCFKSEDLLETLKEIGCDNAKKEYYLTDAVKILADKGRKIESVTLEDSNEMIGVNSRVELAQAASVINRRISDELMMSGVTIQDPETTTIYPGVKIGKDSVIYPNTIIESDVVIADACHIGPFAHLRPGTRVGKRAEIGNFVELVRTQIGESTKVKHHTYLGDAKVGNNVNIGAGTITANYDGKNKNNTVIGDNSFIGVGTILIAPVKIGKRAMTGAGTVVLKGHNIKDGATAVGVPARILERRRSERRGRR